MSRGPEIVVVTEAVRAAAFDGLRVASADEYLEGRADVIAKDLAVVNLCRSYQYLSRGYYVSLLADARHQQVFPTLQMIEETRNPSTYLRTLREAGIAIADARTIRECRRGASRVAVAPDGEFVAPPGGPWDDALCAETWSIFGKTPDVRFRDQAAAVFGTYSFPIVKLRLYLDEDRWKVGQVLQASISQLDPPELDLLVRELSRPRFVPPRRTANTPRPHRIACLWDAEDPLAASDRDTLDRFAIIAAQRGLLFERIAREDLQRLAEYDALFIRTVTAIDHYSFTFAQTAESLGIPVIDDPQSIIRCSNKVYLQELFRRNGIATPRTVTISRKTPLDEVRVLGLPLIVKLPDGTFSQAVKKADDLAALETIAQEMFKRSPLLIVQEFIPTAFDWRIGVLGGRVLFTCKYHMADGHWQIVNSSGDGERQFGQVEAVHTADVPPAVLALALESTALLGDGLYGVDVKDTPNGPVVIEINDNPNIQTGFEDGLEKDRIYETLLETFVSRIRSRTVTEERA